MITEDDFAEALKTDDPEMSFVRLETRFRAVLEKNLEATESNGAYNSFVIEYMNHAVAVAQALGLDILQGWEIPHHSYNSSLHDTYRDFITDVDHYKVKIQIDRLRQRRKFSVPLAPTDKERIRHYVAQIKTIIDKSELSADKKDALYNKINAFLAEVDKDRAALAAWSDFSIGVAHTFGEMAKEAEPVRKFIDSISRLLGRAQEIDEKKNTLPSPPTPKRLEPPKRRLLPPQRKRGDFDDEIPF
jgi:hypothetical protein